MLRGIYPRPTQFPPGTKPARRDARERKAHQDYIGWCPGSGAVGRETRELPLCDPASRAQNSRRTDHWMERFFADLLEYLPLGRQLRASPHHPNAGAQVCSVQDPPRGGSVESASVPLTPRCRSSCHDGRATVLSLSAARTFDARPFPSPASTGCRRASKHARRIPAFFLGPLGLRGIAPLRPLPTPSHGDPPSDKRPECENTCGTPFSEEHPQGIRCTAMLQLDPARILSPCCAPFPRTCF